jgi:hypothetical protein
VSLDSRENLDSVKKLVSNEIEKFVEIWNFRHFSTVCLYLDWEVRGFLYFLVKISQSFETLGLDNVEISQQISTASRQISTASWQILKISTRLNNLDKNLDASKSRLKNLDLKNLDQEKKKVDLDRRENLDNLKKLVSTRRTFSISIGLDCRDPQA